MKSNTVNQLIDWHLITAVYEYLRAFMSNYNYSQTPNYQHFKSDYGRKRVLLLLMGILISCKIATNNTDFQQKNFKILLVRSF